jgi:hypothetical protein
LESSEFRSGQRIAAEWQTLGIIYIDGVSTNSNHDCKKNYNYAITVTRPSFPFQRVVITPTGYQFRSPAIAQGARFGLRARWLAARFLAPKRLIIHVRRTVHAAGSRRSNVSRGGAAGAGGQGSSRQRRSAAAAPNPPELGARVF